MTAEIKVSVTKKFQSSSHVNKYDLLTLEQSTQSLTEDRILLAFQAFDELIPHLGVFTRIFHKLRNDLFGAVYSDELTGTAENNRSGDSEYIQRLPYFSLVQRVYNDRHEIIEQLKSQLDVAEKRLFDKNRQLEVTQETLAGKDNYISTLCALKEELESLVQNKNRQLNELRDELEDTETTSRLTEHHLTCDIREMMESLDEAKNEIKLLSKFKKGYDDLNNAFTYKNDTLEDKPTKNRKHFISTKQSNLQSGVESGQKLEEQILTMINIAIEEYDKFMETHKFNPSEKVVNEDIASTDQSLLEIYAVEQEIENVKIKFQNSVNKLLTEFALLQKHNTMLVEQLQKIEEIKPTLSTSNSNTDRKPDNGKICQLEDLLKMKEEVRKPFIPHERVFSKYAAILFTSSNNGKTYEEFKDANYCASCEEKTVICPHKICGPNTIFKLPLSCSHIKLTRPTVKISKHCLSDSQKRVSPQSILDVSGLAHAPIPDQLQSSHVTLPAKTSMILPVKDRPDYMIHTMQRLWDDYKQRTKTDRAVPRSLELERTRSLMEQFLGYLMWTDEFMTDNEANISILDTFYCFMRNRYLVEDVMFMAVHDILTAIVTFCEIDKMIELLGHMFVGNLDAACLRYVLLMLDIISRVTWKEVEDFRPFSSVVYPFLNDDDLESLQMSYTSYSENKISSHLVFSFIVHIIQKNREPRFQNFQKKLAPYQNDKSEHLSDIEFKEALDNLLPLCNELTRRRLYLQSQRADEWNGIIGAVSIMRLVQISGYLELQHISSVMKDSVAQRVYKWRERPRSAVTGLNQVAAVVPATTILDWLPTMEHIKQLASELNRQITHRDERKSSFVVDW